MESYQGGRGSRLSAEHRRVLVEGSGISPEVLSEWTVRTIHKGRDLPRGFSRGQRRRAPGMLFEMPRPGGGISYIFRPDRPDPENPGRKYEQPCKAYGGPGNTLGVYGTSPEALGDTSVPLYFVEGAKKALSLVSAYRAAGREVVAVAISGVWNWLSEGAPISDLEDLLVEGRPCGVVYDSDMLRNPDVQGAAGRLSENLLGRGGSVRVAYLSDSEDGSKTGADDFFAGGGTVEGLEALMRPYHPDDFAVIRLERNEKLAGAVEDLEGRFWAATWAGKAGFSDRRVFKALVRAARRQGALVEGGIRVKQAWGDLLDAAKVSRRTLWKSIGRLEERGVLWRDNGGRRPEEAGAFVIRSDVNQVGEKGGVGEKVTGMLRGWHPPGLHQRAFLREYLKREGQWARLADLLPMPELSGREGLDTPVPGLLWGTPARKGGLGLVRDTRMVRQGVREPRVPASGCLGKIAEAILDVLYLHGGAATVGELFGVSLKSRRPCDFARRHLPVLVEVGLIAVEGRGKSKVVTLLDDWLERLEEIRVFNGEVERDEARRRAVARQREAYRNRLRVVPDPHPVNRDADGWVEDLVRVEDGEGELIEEMEAAINEVEDGAMEEAAPMSPLARALGRYLERNPDDACQSPYWLATTLWGHDLYPGKPTREELSEALEELGGDAYRSTLLRGEEVAA